jgi:exonuclease SbcD
VLSDAHGPVAFSALPFAYELAAQACFADAAMQTPEDVLAAQVAAARRNLPPGARWVIVAHAFVSGAQGSDSERPLARVGGIETVRPEVFDGADYVALGHLHRPQAIGAAHIRYAGAPLAFGFDEEGAEKSMTLVDLGAAGQVSVTTLPFRPLRGVRTLRGKHAELLLAAPSEDFVQAVLADEVPVIDGMKRLREVFPNACALSYARDARAPELKSLAARGPRVADPVTVVGDFLELIRDTRLSEDEARVVAAALHDLQQGGDAA